MSDNVLGFPHGAHSNTYPCDVEPPCECEPKGEPYKAVFGDNPVPLRTYTNKPTQSHAAKILEHASNLIDGDRDVQHGNRYHCHATIAAYWGLYLGRQLKPEDVAKMMALLKIARTQTGAHNEDCYVDGAAYLALAGELATDQ